MKRHAFKALLIAQIIALCFIFGGMAAAQTTPPPDPDEIVPVIIELNIITRPENELSGMSGVVVQRTAIANAQTRTITSLRASNIAVENVRTFTTLPAVALAVPRSQLDELRADPMVRAIFEDRLSPPLTQNANLVVGAPTAWASGLTGAGYAVAVLDTGVDFNHPALIGSRVQELCFSSTIASQNVVSACPNGTTQQIGGNAAFPKDCDGCDHGTHVAGIAGGDGTGRGGIHENFRGVAPGAGIIGVQVFSIVTDSAVCSSAGYGTPCTFSYDSDQMRAMEFLFTNRNNFGSWSLASINMSLGGGLYSSTCDFDYPNSYRNAVTNLVNNRIAVIAASGNNGSISQMGAPACISNVISVASTTNNDTVSSFSNVSPVLDFFAPGDNIRSTVTGDSFNPLTPGAFGYVNQSGTSMATPYVAGAWAIMRQNYPTESVDQIRNRLATTGVMISDVNSSHPRIDIGEAATPADGLIRWTSSSSAVTAVNGVHSVPFRLTVTGSPGQVLRSPLKIDLTYGGTALRNVNYTAPSSITLTRAGGWPPGVYNYDGLFQIQVNTTTPLAALTRTIVVTMSDHDGGVNVTIGTPNPHTVTLTQGRGTLALDAEDTNPILTEGDSYTIPLSLVVTGGPPHVPAFTANINYHGDAINGTDYTAPATVEFNQSPYIAGTYTATLTVNTIDRGDDLQGYRDVLVSIGTLSGAGGLVTVAGDPVHIGILDGVRGRFTLENPLHAAMMSVITSDPAVQSVEFTLPDFRTTPDQHINISTRLSDGSVGAVEVRFGWDLFGPLQISYRVVDSPSAAYTQAVNRELPYILTEALQMLQAEFDLPDPAMRLYRIDVQETFIEWFFVTALPTTGFFDPPPLIEIP